MTRKGFTLMELLVVIGIIMILLGMLFPAMNMVKKQAMKTRCRSQIAQVTVACEHYRLLNGDYPDSLLIKSTLMPAATPKTADTISESDWVAVAGELLPLLAKSDRDPFGVTGYSLLDPWKVKVLRYRPVKYYPYLAGAPIAIDTDAPPHPDSFQIWSASADEIDQHGDKDTDDITNWKQ